MNYSQVRWKLFNRSWLKVWELLENGAARCWVTCVAEIRRTSAHKIEKLFFYNSVGWHFLSETFILFDGGKKSNFLIKLICNHTNRFTCALSKVSNIYNTKNPFNKIYVTCSEISLWFANGLVEFVSRDYVLIFMRTSRDHRQFSIKHCKLLFSPTVHHYGF